MNQPILATVDFTRTCPHCGQDALWTSTLYGQKWGNTSDWEIVYTDTCDCMQLEAAA